MDVEIHPRRKYIFDDYVDVSTKFKPVNGPQDDTKWPKTPSNIRIMPGDFGGASENGLDSADYNFLSGAITELVGLSSNLDVRVPKSYEEAKQSPDWHLWKQACNAELAALRDTDTYCSKPRASNMEILQSDWEFSIGEDGVYRAKVVAKTRQTLDGSQYEITTRALPRFDTMRLFFSVAARYGFQMVHMKFNSAYFNINLREDMYLQPPPGFIVGGKKVDDKVLKLHNIIEGFIRAPIGRDVVIYNEFKDLGFATAGFGYDIYCKGSGVNAVLIFICEEDLLIAARNPEKVKQVKNKLVSKYHMRDLGVPKKIRGINVEVDNACIKIHMEDYINSLLRDYSMEDCAPSMAPTNGRAFAKPRGTPKVDDFKAREFRSLLAKLLYAAMTTRVDLVHTITDLARYVKHPKERHWTAAKNVVRYLRATKVEGIVFDSECLHDRFIMYSGAEFGDRPGDQFLGRITTLFGAPINWKCRFSERLKPQRRYSARDDSDSADSDTDLDDGYSESDSEDDYSEEETDNRPCTGQYGTMRFGLGKSQGFAQLMKDIGLGTPLEAYSIIGNDLSSIQSELPYFDPKNRDRNGRCVQNIVRPNEKFSAAHINQCRYALGVDPSQLVTRKLNSESLKSLMSVLNPKPSVNPIDHLMAAHILLGDD